MYLPTLNFAVNLPSLSPVYIQILVGRKGLEITKYDLAAI